MAKRKKNMIYGSGNDTINLYYTGIDTDFVEIPLKYDVWYMYDGVNGDLISGQDGNPGIKQEIEEKIGTENLNDYITGIFENSENMSRLNGSTYQHENSSILNPNSPIAPYSSRLLNIAHWNGVFPFIEYFTYKLPDKMFDVSLYADQGITIEDTPRTYTPIFLYGVED